MSTLPDTCEFFFTIPTGAKILVSNDQKIEADTVLASGKSEGKIFEYDLCKLFSISPKEVTNSLQIVLGSKVKVDDLIAKSKGFLKKEAIFVSPVEGILESITEKGVLKIRAGQEDFEIKSPVSGLVKNIENDKINIAAKGKKFEAVDGFGKSAWGKLFVLNEEEILNLPPLAGKIVVFSEELPKAIANKAEACGAVGLVGEKFSKNSTLGEIIICIFSDQIIEEIKKFNGKKVQINGEQKYLLIPND